MRSIMVALSLLLGFTAAFAQTQPTRRPLVGGSPTIVAQSDITNQVAEILTPVTLVMPSADAFYRISVYAEVTQTNHSGGAWCLNFSFQDLVGPKQIPVLISTTPNDGGQIVVSRVQTFHDVINFPVTYTLTACKGGLQDTDVPLDANIILEQLE